MAAAQDTDGKLSGLRNNFSDLLDLDSRNMFANLGVRDIPKGEYLFMAEEEAEALYFVARGCFAVHKPVGIGNRSQAVALLSRGALVGEAAFFAGRRRGATMIAVEDSQVLELTGNVLAEIERDDPQLYIALLKRTLGAVAQRLQKSSERLALIL